MLPFLNELKEEIYAIADFWESRMTDRENDGFYGRIDFNNNTKKNADKGAVLNARILWAFSAAFRFDKTQTTYLDMAERAYNYISDYFLDPEYGGAYWALDFKGNPKETRKQIYAQSFVIYAFAEYFKISRDTSAKDSAIALFRLIEEHSFDKDNNGYLEAFGRNWGAQEDMRLSEKDMNEKKTMNTHLHIIEAYTNLYSIWKNEKLKNKIINLLNIFEEHFINKNNWHLHLFFDEYWNLKSRNISYGHDIEASWLLLDAANTTNNDDIIEKYKHFAINIANIASEALDTDGGLWNEYDFEHKKLIQEKHWWPQAEALAGFANAWQLSKDKKFLDRLYNSWEFINKHIKDHKNGEWFWGIDKNYLLLKEDKSGMWKCPYHNLRACILTYEKLYYTIIKDSIYNIK